MKNFILIIIYLLSTIVYSQSESNYDIYIIANSNKKEVITYNNKINDSILIKSFSISNSRFEANPKYYLKMDEKGVIVKNIVGSTNADCCKITFLHNSNKNKKIRISKNKKRNIIDYETFQNIKFSNLIEIIKNASKVYFIDIGNNDTEDKCHTAYEVTF